MQDYTANSDRSKKKKAIEKESEDTRPVIEKVVTGEVKIRKKTLGEKFRGFFLGGDARGVMHYVVSEVLVPAGRDLAVDAIRQGSERVFYGEGAVRRKQLRTGSSGGLMSSRSFVTQYNSPVQAPNRGPGMGIRDNRAHMSDTPTQSIDRDLVFPSRAEAERVLDAMNEILSQGYFVSVGDFKTIVGITPEHTDERWGWESVRGSSIKQTREGYLLNLPSVVSN